jgi:predicted protein tyrosine phosphatase
MNRNIHVLFVCTHNQLRSPTAESVFRGRPNLEVKSAGVGFLSTVPLTPHLLEWADIIFVMEERHRKILREKYRVHDEKKPIICLSIPDIYNYMDPALVELLEKKVPPFIEKMLAHREQIKDDVERK